MSSSTKPTASKPKTASQRPGAPASCPQPLDGPALTTDGIVLVAADGLGGGGSGAGVATTRTGHGGGQAGKPRGSARTKGAGEGGGDKGARASTEIEIGGGPAKDRGEGPKCGSLTGAERASARATDALDPINAEDIPSISGEYTPASDHIPHASPKYTPPSATNIFLGVQINVDPPDPESAVPPPGTSVRKPTIHARLGRDENGKIIPHERNEELAKQIAKWCAIGADITEIAQYTGIRPGVLRKHYKMELENGKFAADMMVGETILELAASGKNERMTLLYAKARMGWRESDANDSNNAALLNIHIHT